MQIGTRLRWTLYAIAAAATAAAIWNGDREPSAATEVVRPTRSARPAAAPVAVDSSQRRPIDSGDPIAQRAAASRASSNDPFAEEVQAAVRVAASVPAAAPVAVAPAAPPLPYTYVGRWDEDGKTVVYLQESGQGVVQVHGPGRLNERYAVESVTAERMVLKYLPLGLRQTLALARPDGGAQPTDSTMQAGAPAAGRADEEN